MSAVELRHSELVEFSKMCAPEYNMPEFSDRVLVFDIIQDWQTTSAVHSNSAATELNETDSNVPVEKSSGKRSLEITDEAPEQKRRIKIKIEPNDERQVGLSMENRNTKLPCEQTEVKQIDKPSVLSPHPFPEDVSENSVIIDSNGTQESSSEPLRQHKIYIHSVWLSVQSPYFRSLLHSSDTIATHGTEIYLKIPESEENAHLTLVEAMYRSDVLDDKTVDELLAVLELADKYDVKFVFKKCKLVLQENATSLEVSTQIMHVIKVKHNMDDVEDLAATLQLLLTEEFNPLDQNWQSEIFTSLSEPSVKYLLSSDDLIVQSENTVFHALMYWMEQNEIDPVSMEETNDLIAAVRFRLVTIDYLYNVIKSHSIGSRMPGMGDLCFTAMTYHAVPLEQRLMLEEKPVMRKKPEGNITQYTFVVKKQDFATAKETGTYTSPNAFWACGYKVSVGLTRTKASDNVKHDGIYPQLNVHNLNKASLVPLKFSFQKPKFSICWQEETFTLNSCSRIYSKSSLSWTDLNGVGKTCMLFVAVAPFSKRCINCTYKLF